MALNNGQIADIMDLLGDLYELDGADSFRVGAYHKAATALRTAAESAWRLSEEGRLTEMQGIGKTLAAKVDELRETGTIGSLERLRERYPVGLVEVMHLPGLGARTAKQLHESLGVTSLAELEEAARAGRVRTLPRMSEKREQTILETIAAGAGPRKQEFLREDAIAVAEQFLRPLREHPACVAAEAAGSLRRGRETVGDLDLIAASESPGELTAWFAEHPLAGEITGRGDTKCSLITHQGMQVDLRVVPPESYGNLLQHFTGSKAHNIALREEAAARGLKVSEWGIETVEDGSVLRCPSEREVYEALGYPLIPPELREGSGELAAAREGRLPELVELGDLRGDLHTHTDASDGKATLEQMVEAARALGHTYLAVTDHSAGVGMGIGLEADALLEHAERVRAYARELAGDGFTLLAGSEVDVMADGSLYYDDDVLAQLDWVVASVHVGQRQDADRMTARLLSAVENPNVDVLGHPSGRRFGRRDGYAFDVERVVRSAAEHGTFLEINCQPERMDLRPSHARLALAAGCRLVINTDAHRTYTLGRLPLGVAVARRAWATREDVLNARAWDEIEPLRKPTRRAGARR